MHACARMAVVLVPHFFFARRCYRSEHPTRRGTEAGAEAPGAKQAGARPQASTTSAQETGQDGTGQDQTKRGRRAERRAGRHSRKQASKRSGHKGLAKRRRGPQNTYNRLTEPTRNNLTKLQLIPRASWTPPTPDHQAGTTRHPARTNPPTPRQAPTGNGNRGQEAGCSGEADPDKQHTPARGARMHWQLTAARLKGHETRRRQAGRTRQGQASKAEREQRERKQGDNRTRTRTDPAGTDDPNPSPQH